MAKCQATITEVTQDGKNSVTYECSLEEGHAGPHQDSFKLGGNRCMMIWEKMEDYDGKTG